jgi:hypothetical protein
MQIFHHSTNTISRVSIYGAVFIAALLGGVLYAIELSPIYTRVNEAREQPVPFSHKHHAASWALIAATATPRWKNLRSRAFRPRKRA